MKGKQHPLVGVWSYSIDSPQGIITGQMTVTEVEGELAGVFRSDVDNVETVLDALSFEEDVFMMAMTSTQYGKITAQATLEGDAFEGTMDVVEFGVTGMSFTGMRLEPDGSE